MEWKIGVRRQGAQKTGRSRALRHTETDAERKFWSCVRDRRFLGLKFRRQVPLFVLELNPHPDPLLFKETCMMNCHGSVQ